MVVGEGVGVEGSAATWRERFKVRAYEVGAHGVVEAWTLWSWLQETAGKHVLALGWSIAELNREGLTWVLARLHLRVLREAVAEEEVRVTTWPSGAFRLYAIREFLVEDGGGKTIASATTAWLLVNVATKRPLRLPQAITGLHDEAHGRVIPDEFRKLPEPKAGGWSRALRVGVSALDVNRHANSTAILTWLIDTLPAEVIDGRRLGELEVEYRGEALLGDDLTAQASEGGRRGEYLHSLVRASDGRELARSVTSWVT